MKKFKIRETGVILKENRAHFTTPTGTNYSEYTLKELGLHLDPIEDPAPRKLYAIREVETGFVKFCDRDIVMFSRSTFSEVKYERAPEFDLIYPLDGKDGE